MNWYGYMKSKLEKIDAGFHYPAVVGSICWVIENIETNMTKEQKFDAISEIIKAYNEISDIYFSDYKECGRGHENGKWD